jgi:signal transduction histidine kinase
MTKSRNRPSGRYTSAEEVARACESVVGFSTLPIAAIHRTDHTLVYANSAFCRLLGKRLNDVLGRPFCGLMPEAKTCLPLLDAAFETGKVQTYMGAEDGTPSTAYWAYSLWPFIRAGHAMSAVMFQVTETREAHLRLVAANEALLVGSVRQHELTAEAVALNLRLERLNEDLKQFAFSASHDLQEPLRVISMYSQLLTKSHAGNMEADAAAIVGSITQGARQMRDLLTDLLQFAEAGDDIRDCEGVDLTLVLQEVKQNLRVALAESGAIVTSRPLPVVIGRDIHFIQLFQNLILNAIKYRSAAPPQVHVSAKRHGDFWRVSVADNGIGIAAEHHRTIFVPLTRLNGRSIAGTGLGLAICQRVVESYGGSIGVESELGAGAIFHFDLPIAI